MKNNLKGFLNWQAATQLLFVAVAFFLVVWASMGFDIDLAKLTDYKFWYLCIAKLAVVLAIHNSIFGIYSNGLRMIEESKYYVTVATNRKRVDKIYDQKLFSNLDIAVKDENKDAYIKACNQALREVTTRLSYEDLNIEAKDENSKPIPVDTKAICKKFILGWWQSLLLKRVIKKIVNGKIKYDIMDADDILKDKDAAKDVEISPAFDMRKFLFKLNRNKAITFLVSTVAMTIFAFNQPDMNFWQSLITNSVLLLNSLISGISMANSYIKTRTAVFEQKNRFLERRMGINNSYEPTNPEKPNPTQTK